MQGTDTGDDKRVDSAGRVVVPTALGRSLDEVVTVVLAVLILIVATG